MNIADKFIKLGDSKCALVVGAETLSRITNWDDRNTCVLFADGAGAAVLQATDSDKGILSAHLHSDGKFIDVLSSSHPSSKYKDIISEDNREVWVLKVKLLKFRGCIKVIKDPKMMFKMKKKETLVQFQTYLRTIHLSL